MFPPWRKNQGGANDGTSRARYVNNAGSQGQAHADTQHSVNTRLEPESRDPLPILREAHRIEQSIPSNRSTLFQIAVNELGKPLLESEKSTFRKQVPERYDHREQVVFTLHVLVTLLSDAELTMQGGVGDDGVGPMRKKPLAMCAHVAEQNQDLQELLELLLVGMGELLGDGSLLAGCEKRVNLRHLPESGRVNEDPQRHVAVACSVMDDVFVVSVSVCKRVEYTNESRIPQACFFELEQLAGSR